MVSRLRILREHHAPSCDAGHDVDLLNAASGNFVKGAVTLLQPTTSRVIRPPPALVYWVADVWGLEQEVLTSAATMCGPGLFPLPPRLALNTLVTAMVPEGFRLETDHPLYDRDTPFTRPSMGYADQCDMHFKHTWKKAVVTAKRGHRVVLWVTVGGKGAGGRDLGAGGEGVDVRRVLYFPKGALPAGPRVTCRAKHRRPNGPSTAEAWTATRVDGQHTVQGPAERSDMADHRLVMSPTDKATDVWLFEPSASAEDPPQSQLTALSLAVAGTCCPLPPRGTTHDVMFYTRGGAAINLALRHCPPGAEIEDCLPNFPPRLDPMIAYKKVWPDAGEDGGSQPTVVEDRCLPTLRVHTKLVRVLRDVAGLNRRSPAEKAAAAVMARAVETLSVHTFLCPEKTMLRHE